MRGGSPLARDRFVQTINQTGSRENLGLSYLGNKFLVALIRLEALCEVFIAGERLGGRDPVQLVDWAADIPDQLYVRLRELVANVKPCGSFFCQLQKRPR